MPSIARITIIAFGLTSFTAGIFTLYNPDQSLQLLDLPLAALPASRANALAAVAMGIYYTLAAYQDNVAFFTCTVPMRLLTATVFWAQGWYAASLWEGAGSITTAIALGWDKTRMKRKDE
ncbi:hypothetical protein B0J13DRAFT_560411 [Dactylonectria estremocensis]|uniref:Uncharacterized protein n=1 Tax=Dactylonectria estremocensis TaxID=1079267 RepID=A0A9P9IVG2_9HYPO|nr:hypothetical protein B0J13DRAFT_560411 [Dactylonectria estremocensis]